MKEEVVFYARKICFDFRCKENCSFFNDVAVCHVSILPAKEGYLHIIVKTETMLLTMEIKTIFLYI